MLFLKVAKPILLDFLSTFVFLLAFGLLHNAKLAIILGIASGVIEMGWQYARSRKISLMEIASLALVIVFGVTSLITHDMRFVMVKPSISYVAIGIVMLKPGWQLHYAPEIARQLLPPVRFVQWGYVWATLMLLSAAFNLALVATVDIKSWATWVTIWGLSSKAALFCAQYFTLRTEAVKNYRAMPKANGAANETSTL